MLTRQQPTLIKTILFTILFVIFVTPHSFYVGGQGISGNYLFVFFPLLMYIYSKQFERPKLEVIVFMILLFCMFTIALIYQSEYIVHYIRRFASFIVFMSIFAFMFVKIDSNMIRSFKYAMVIFSLYTAISVLINYIDLGGAELRTYAKGAVGSTRIGFIYVFALWIVYFFDSRTMLLIIIKHVVAIIIIIGLLLTYSRASLFALTASVCVYFVVTTLVVIKEGKSFYQLLLKISLSAAYIVGLVIILGSMFPNVISQGDRMIYKYIAPSESSVTNTTKLDNTTNTTKLDNTTNTTKLDNTTNTTKANVYTSRLVREYTDKDTSLGYRVYVANQAINFVFENPFTGSGFLGVWIMFDEIKGSAHSQFIDVFFRLGFIGFFIYMFFTYKIMRFLYLKDLGLFVGFIGMLSYGLFHETFKLSHGAFVFAFLFAMYDQYRYSFNKLKHSQ